MKVLADSVSGESQTSCSQTVMFSMCPHMAEGARQLSRVSFRRTLILFVRLSSYDLPKSPPPYTTAFEVRISTYEFGRDANFHSIALV